MPRRFRWTRLQRINQDATRQCEAVISTLFVLLPGLILLLTEVRLPPAAEYFLQSIYLTDKRLGLTLVVGGLAQLWGAGTDWYHARANIAFLLGCIAVATMAAYFQAGVTDRYAMGFLPGVWIAEWYLCWRCFHTTPESDVERRGRFIS